MSPGFVPYPEELFAAGNRHAFIFAHQDDDLPYAGMLARLHERAEVAWMTNGDGLAPHAGMDPQEYARLRYHECVAAMSILGYQLPQLTFMGHSELDIYQLLIDLARVPADRALTLPLRNRIRHLVGSVEEAIRPRIEKADVVWALAWQGGHVEHDLSHYITARVVRQLSIAGGVKIPFYELPAYEIFFLVPLRFAPWHKGEAHRFFLTPEELQLKEAAFAAYESQVEITHAFKHLIRVYGIISALRLKPFGFKKFAGQEHFGPVFPDRDYKVSPHRRPLFDYILEDYKKVRITFANSLGRIVEEMEG